MIVFWMLSESYREKLVFNFKEQSLALLQEEIKKKYDVIHAVSIAYAYSDEVRQAVAYEDRKALSQIIDPMRATFARLTPYKRYSFHFITHDGRSLYRSFDKEVYGQDLTGHHLVREALQTRASVQGLDVGGFGTFYRLISIEPIWEDGELLGFIAVSQGIRHLIISLGNRGFNYGFFPADKNSEQLKTYSLDKRDYFKNNPLKELVLEPSAAKKPYLTSNNHYVFLETVSKVNDDPVAFHAISVTKENFNESLWQQQKQFLFVIFLAFASVLLTGAVYLKRLQTNVSSPLKTMTDTIDEIIHTEDYSKQVNLQMDDEIGRLSDYFNHLINNTEGLLYKLKYQQEAIDRTLIVSRTDPYGTIIYVNQQFCNISGYAQDELIGQPHNIVRHPNMPTTTFKEIWQTILAKKTWSGEIQNRRKDGSDYYVHSHIIPILNKNGEIVEFMSIREDITLMVHLRESLRQSMDNERKEKLAAEKANQAKSEFLSSMSHELRTPLNAIIGFGQLLQISHLDEKQIKQVSNILSSSQHLLQLINDILEFAKLDAGKLSLSLEPIELMPVLNEVVQLTEPQAKDHQVNIEIDRDGLGYLLMGDRVRLKQVLLNLITNAIKYNRPGGFVRIHSEKIRHQNKLYLKLCVKDNGVGISKENLQYLFDPFHRLGHENSNIEGTGIGLTITQSLVEKMHGWIEVESTPKVGSLFKIFLPLIKTKSIQNSIEQKSEIPIEIKEIDRQDTDDLKVLYVEDNQDNRLLMSDIMDSIGGVQLTFAVTAEEGLEVAQRIKPKLIFMDINLPGMDGHEALPFYKALPELMEEKTRFFAISANVLEEQISQAMSAGFEDYYAKPIDLQKITSLIHSMQKN